MFGAFIFWALYPPTSRQSALPGTQAMGPSTATVGFQHGWTAGRCFTTCSTTSYKSTHWACTGIFHQFSLGGSFYIILSHDFSWTEPQSQSKWFSNPAPSPSQDKVPKTKMKSPDQVQVHIPNRFTDSSVRPDETLVMWPWNFCHYKQVSKNTAQFLKPFSLNYWTNYVGHAQPWLDLTDGHGLSLGFTLSVPRVPLRFWLGVALRRFSFCCP